MSAFPPLRPSRAGLALLALGVAVLAPPAAAVAQDAAAPRFKVVLVDRGDRAMEAAGAVVVRGAPEADAPQVDRLTPGATVTMTGRVMGAYQGDVPWVAVRLGDGREGYVLQSALKAPQPAAPSPTPQPPAPQPEAARPAPPPPPATARPTPPATPAVPSGPRTYSKGGEAPAPHPADETRTYDPRTYQPATPRAGAGDKHSSAVPSAPPGDCRIEDKAALRGRNLSDCDLVQADLRLADLREAKLQRAKLSRAQLAGAWLQGADLSDAVLDHADLSGAHADGALFRRAHLDDAAFKRAELAGADFDGASLRGAAFGGAILRGAILRRSDLSGAQLREADAREADFAGAQVAGVYWTGTRVDGADLRGMSGLDRSALALAYGVAAAKTDPPPDDLKPVTEFFGKLLQPQEPR